MTVALSARLSRAPRDSVVGSHATPRCALMTRTPREERRMARRRRRSCSCVTARPSGAAPGATRRTATSRSPSVGASRRASLATRLAGIDFALVLMSPRSRARRDVRARRARRPRRGHRRPRRVELRRLRGPHDASRSAPRCPGWTIFTDGAPGGETADEVGARADRRARARGRGRWRGRAVLARALPPRARRRGGSACPVVGRRAARRSTPRPQRASVVRARAACAASVELVSDRARRAARAGTVGAAPSPTLDGRRWARAGRVRRRRRGGAARGDRDPLDRARARARWRPVLALRAATSTRSLDALRLSEAMTLKAAIAGLHQGGGKAVVQWDDPDRAAARRRCCTRSVAPSTTSAVATSRPRTSARRPADMNALAAGDAVGHRRRRVARWLGRPVAGHRVRRACTRCARRVPSSTASASLRGRRVSSCRASGTSARISSRLLVGRRRGGRRVGRVRRSRDADALARELGVEHVAHRRRARDAVRRARAVRARWRARRRVDPASAVPRDRRCREQPARSGRRRPRCSPRAASLYAPDFVANAGGIINIAEEFVGYDRERALARAAEIEPTTTRVRPVAARAAASRRCAPPSSSPAPASPRKAPAAAGNPAIPPPGRTANPSPGSARDHPPTNRRQLRRLYAVC